MTFFALQAAQKHQKTKQRIDAIKRDSAIDLADALARLNRALTNNGLQDVYAIVLASKEEELKLRKLYHADDCISRTIGGNTMLMGTYVFTKLGG